jgi:hypothetical protein
VKNKFGLSLLLFILLTGIIGIGLIIILDDPDHIADPDPNCPLCLAAQTNFIFSPNILFFPLIQFLSYLIYFTYKNNYPDAILIVFSSRAPPSR